MNPAILPSQDNSLFEMSVSCFSSLVMNGLRLASAKDEVVLVRVVPRYEIPFLLHVYGRVFCNRFFVVWETPKSSIRDLVKLVRYVS